MQTVRGVYLWPFDFWDPYFVTEFVAIDHCAGSC